MAGCLSCPEHQVGLTALDRSGHLRKVPRVEGSIAVHEADDVLGTGREAGPAGGAEPATGSSTTRAPKSRRACADPSEDPLSTTRGVNPRGIRDSTHGSASISSRTGRMTSGIPGPYPSTDVTETSKRLRIA